ncbi:MAG TPA: hypothetical protein VGB00_09955 [Pyrinomonadaceae bacterium]|jgi:hypothetical protein
MTEINDIRNNAEAKEPVRCSKCDTVIDHYNTFLSPTNETNDVCAECLLREDKGFNTKRDWKRASRRGVIPR